MSGDHLPRPSSLAVDHGTAQNCRVAGGDHASEYDRRIADHSCVEVREVGIGEHWLAAARRKEALLIDDVIVRRAASEAVVNDLTQYLAVALLRCFQPLLLYPEYHGLF